MARTPKSNDLGGLAPKKLRAAIRSRFGAVDVARLRGLLLANGVSADVRSYLDGAAQPSVPTLCAIAELLGVEVGDLVDVPKLAGGRR